MWLFQTGDLAVGTLGKQYFEIKLNTFKAVNLMYIICSFQLNLSFNIFKKVNLYYYFELDNLEEFVIPN